MVVELGLGPQVAFNLTNQDCVMKYSPKNMQRLVASDLQNTLLQEVVLDIDLMGGCPAR